MPSSVPLNVNGRATAVEVDDPDMPLLYALRNNLGLHGPRFGCGLGQCGSCTVHIDGEAVRSCVTPLAAVGPGQKVVTLEGLGSPENPHRVQKAFMDEQAVQCGYCINGMIMQAAAFLAKSPRPSDAEIKEAMAANICRCGTHVRILRAIKRASGAA
jgi:nicotinate dehydrogenase subunit A